MKAQRRRGCSLIFQSDEPAGNGCVRSLDRGQGGDEVKPTDGEMRINLHLLRQRIDARAFAVFAAGAGRVLRRSTFVTVVVAVVMAMVAAVVCRQHGHGTVLTMR